MVNAYFENIRHYILEELDKASDKIVVAIYWFTNESLFNKLLEKLENGVEVELIIYNDYINNRETGLDFQKFIDVGGKFYFSNSENPMHNKFCIIDEMVLINGSYNWTYYAEDRNKENILIIRNELETIKAFSKEFERLKNLMGQVDKVNPLTQFEVDEFNLLRARDYLANDIIYQARTTGNISIVENAFQIAPNNIEVQKTAYDLNLTKKYKLRHSIGSSLHLGKYLIIIPKDTFIPIIKTQVVQTVSDNQTSSGSTIHYGENPIARKNSQLEYISITGIPKKPAGEAKMKFHFSIDIYGNLRMEKYSLDNGKRQVLNKDIRFLLEEVGK